MVEAEPEDTPKVGLCAVCGRETEGSNHCPRCEELGFEALRLPMGDEE